MDPNSERIIELFSQAMSKPAEARAAFLAEACRDEPEVRQQVESLMRAAEPAREFLKQPLSQLVPVPELPAEKPGDKIGRYKLREKVGEGGCGVVYVADQEEPVRRRVALKVIKLGMDTRQVIARFEAERQALALMDHPNIAKVLDAGATETGRPYFVMELVRGIKITEYCDQSQCTTRQRLDLFMQVCKAIQHAHQKGIIHRDIKPSNILVTLHDGVPVPKVIDFGIAKATEGHLTEQTVYTALHEFIGTPAYISPEQAEMSGLDMDTRSDIYSLGVLLYELLTGKTPFDASELVRAGLDGLRRTIREREPLRPSTKLGTLLGEELTTTARQRGVGAPELVHAIRGDLDWIAMKCLEKDRARRYETANGLARDVERHLRNEPITARPPSRLYEFQKTARRHWVGFSAVGVVIIVLVAGVLASSWEATRARRAERYAVQVGASEARARSEAEQRLYEARLGQARAKRLSGVAGQRFESLAAISEAATIHPSRELSDEALACLTLTDLRVRKTYQLPSRVAAEGVVFDDRLELYAYLTADGISVRRASDGQETVFIPIQGAITNGLRRLNWVRFAPLSRYLSASVMDASRKLHWRLWDLSRGGALALDFIGDFLDFSPDGRTVAVAQDDATVLVQEFDPAKEQRRLNIGARLEQLWFSPDSKRIAGFGGESSTLRIWDAESGRLLLSCLNADKVTSTAWSRDGSLVAVGGDGGGIWLWDVLQGEFSAHLQGHLGRVIGLAFDHDDSVLASSSWDGTLRLWEVSSGRQLLTYPAAISELLFSPDDRTLACANDGAQCQLLELEKPSGYRHVSLQMEHPGTRDFDLTADWRLAAVAGWSGTHLVDVPWGRDLGRLSPVFNCWVRFSTSRRDTLWAAGGRGLYRWHLGLGSQTGQGAVRLEPGEPVLTNALHGEFALDRDEQRVALSTQHREGMLLCELRSPAEPPKFCAHSGATFPASEPTGQWAASGTWAEGGGVKVWDFATGHLLQELPVRGNARVAASPDGNWLATASSTEIRLWDTKSWLPLAGTLATSSTVVAGALAFSPDSRLLATYPRLGEIQLVRVPTLQPVARLVLPPEAKVSALRFSPHGDKLAVLEWTGDMHLWDLGVIRSELQKLGLDWHLPPFPAAAERVAARPPALRLDAGPFSQQELALAIPMRDVNAPADLIDLTAYYNAPLTASWYDRPESHNDLSELPRGLQRFGGVPFDVRGLIQVGDGAANGLSYPGHVLNIPIGRRCQRLHFLHGAISASIAHAGDDLGSYVIHYLDGRRAEMPILVGEDLGDWWSQPNEPHMKFTIAWTGNNPEARKNGRTIRLFKTTWQNPYPTAPIRQLDLVSDKPTPGAPFLVALTAEP